ncbi:uncharacterized protein LOC18791599 [Prunus persica]|uniref:uncharacterized protein LOC18791599 n=1 Tax=Prunus persica TaxID=3760 RepID=UPI0009AB3831|nr:uncharacterized protein LOC18791599 [Prunus persica]
MNRDWIHNKNRLSNQYRAGIQSFMEVASQHVDEKNETPCPCMKCQNMNCHSLPVVQAHLWQYGMSVVYHTWIYHGEQFEITRQASPPATAQEAPRLDDYTHNILNDAFPPDLGVVDDTLGDNEDVGDDTDVHRVEMDKYEKLIAESQRQLFPGSNASVLTAMVQFMHTKVPHHWSNKSFDQMLQILSAICPQPHSIPPSFYAANKMLKDLGLGHEKIDACIYDCALFYKEHKSKDKCPVCDEPRYKPSTSKKKKMVPQKVLRYIPLKPRLQRLFMSEHTAGHMRWHKNKRVDDEGVMRHPADSIAWKEFDKMYPEFAEEPRNIRLGLATDGFNPFGNMSTSYIFNNDFAYSSPKAPGKELDVYLRPLIDELKELWEQGYKACPVCLEDTTSTKLRNKICYMGHHRYLKKNHPWRKDSENFDGTIEMRDPPREFSGDDILLQFNHLVHRKLGKHPDNLDRKRKRTPMELNWTNKSIFFELEYWSKLKIRHNLDVMHIEKNICDNIVGTLLSIEGKTKDTPNARLDLKDMNIRRNLHLDKDENGKIKKYAAEYTLEPADRRAFCEFLKSIKFPDGYAANISRNVKDGKISGLKTHDCHVLLQRILPIGIRPYLIKEVCAPLVELACFFQQICAKTLNVADLDRLEVDIVVILCKLEKIFPPAFFDVMVHLAFHLPREAKLGGPVGYRWMYPIERMLGKLKGYVRNRARPEGSIVEGYIANEALTFCSMYFRNVETVFSRPERNDDGGEANVKLSVFSQNARPFNGYKFLQLSEGEMEPIYWYILDNCEEIEPFRNEHRQILERESLFNIEHRHRQSFPQWFKHHVKALYSEESTLVTKEVYALSYGPDERVCTYTGCVVNGIRWHVKDIEETRTTQNSGVMVPGTHADQESNFYGRLVSVVKIGFTYGYHVILFKCEWYNTSTDVKRKKKIVRLVHDYHLTSVNSMNLWYKDDPYVLAKQAQQIFFLDDPSLGHGWKVIQKIPHRHVWDVLENEVAHEAETLYNDDVDQTAHISVRHAPEDNVLLSPSLRREYVEPEIVVEDINFEHVPTDMEDEDFIDDDDIEEIHSGDDEGSVHSDDYSDLD